MRTFPCAARCADQIGIFAGHCSCRNVGRTASAGVWQPIVSAAHRPDQRSYSSQRGSLFRSSSAVKHRFVVSFPGEAASCLQFVECNVEQNDLSRDILATHAVQIGKAVGHDDFGCDSLRRRRMISAQSCEHNLLRGSAEPVPRYSTSSAVSAPRIQCRACTGSRRTSRPSLRSSAATYSIAACACGDPTGRGPMFSVMWATWRLGVVVGQCRVANRGEFLELAPAAERLRPRVLPAVVTGGERRIWCLGEQC